MLYVQNCHFFVHRPVCVGILHNIAIDMCTTMTIVCRRKLVKRNYYKRNHRPRVRKLQKVYI